MKIITDSKTEFIAPIFANLNRVPQTVYQTVTEIKYLPMTYEGTAYTQVITFLKSCLFFK